MKYVRRFELESESVAALKAFDPSVIALFDLKRPMKRKHVFGIAEAVLESLVGLIPLGESVDGFFMAHEPETPWQTGFAIALREIHDRSYFNLDAVETFRHAISKAKEHPVYGRQVAEAEWEIAPGQKAISEIGGALSGREDVYRYLSDNRDPVLAFFPITGTSIDDGTIGYIAEFIGIYPSTMYTGRRKGVAELQQHKEIWAAAGIA